jgi:hypothetical protein
MEYPATCSPTRGGSESPGRVAGNGSAGSRLRYLRDLRGLSDRTVPVTMWYDEPLSRQERDAKRAELNRLYAVVTGGGTVMLDHCWSGSVSVPCTGDMIARKRGAERALPGSRGRGVKPGGRTGREGRR